MKIWRPLKRIFSKGNSESKEENLIGQVARSVSGRDEGVLYVVTGHEDGVFVTVCDGRRRKASSPKRKNLRHLMMTGRQVPDGFLVKGKLAATDEQISSFLQGCETI